MRAVIRALLPDRTSGSISAEDYQAFWDASDRILDYDEELEIAAAQVQQETANRKPVDRKVLGDAKVQEPIAELKTVPPKGILGPADKQYSILPRGHRELAAEQAPPQRGPSQVGPMDEEMVDSSLEKSFGSPKERNSLVSKKVRFREGIPSNTALQANSAGLHAEEPSESDSEEERSGLTSSTGQRPRGLSLL
ncbi:hypothetical protein IAQ61_009121 [Plenodomus lingam]|uniref:uncharacterized protein n=1 Tax=Leptosphaeria maculans TaxID=5022 RepID=UPI0033217178|nr:hypothetical protein IAQ61_009121 [Plenodomus lingam]